MIASAVTNLDLHDISRTAKTYGVRLFYVVTPLDDQKKLINEIVAHWVCGTGASYNPKRRSAIKLINVQNSIDEVVEHIYNNEGKYPKIVVTSASKHDRDIGCVTFRKMLQSGEPYLLVFGTAWGLAEKFISKADYELEPIMGNSDYNHLSVRCASAIIIDRLMASVI